MDGKIERTFLTTTKTRKLEYTGHITRNGPRDTKYSSLYCEERSRVKEVWEQEEYLG